MGIQGLNKTKKSCGGCHHLLLVYDASQLNTVYVKLVYYIAVVHNFDLQEKTT